MPVRDLRNRRFGATYKYLPSPLEMFDGDECRQSAIQTQKKPTSGKDGTSNNAPLLQNSQPDNLKNEPEPKNHEYECLIAEYTGRLAARLLVVATLLLALFGFWQVMVSRDTARRQLRAYVFVSGAKIIHGITDNSIIEAHVEIKNSGQTPAYKMMAVIGLTFDTYPPPQSITLTVPDQNYLSLRTRIDLGPGDKTFTDTHAGRLLTPLEKDSLVAGTKAIWVYGEIRYRDAFCRKQWTKYRLIIGGPFGVSGGHMRTIS
jgi:hypothetical protein